MPEDGKRKFSAVFFVQYICEKCNTGRQDVDRRASTRREGLRRASEGSGGRIMVIS